MQSILLKFCAMSSIMCLSATHALAQDPRQTSRDGQPISTNVLGGSTVASSDGSTQAAIVQDDVIPADFRGEITYRGNYSGTVRTRADRMRNISVREVFRSASSSRTLPLSGEYELTVRYNGASIIGAFVTRSATGPNGASIDPRGTITGTRNGSTCTFSTEVGGPPAVAYCGRGRWEWVNDNVYNPQGHDVSLRVLAMQLRTVDFAEMERTRALNAERARIAAAEAAARYAALPNAGPALTRTFDNLVQIDSRGWAFNRYSPGSMRNVKIVSGRAGSGTYVMRGEYTFNGGQTGWVMAEMNGQNLSCIRFWDSVLGCRGLRTPEQGQAMRSALADMLSPSGGSSSQQSRAFDEEVNDEIHRRNHENSVIRHAHNNPPNS